MHTCMHVCDPDTFLHVSLHQLMRASIPPAPCWVSLNRTGGHRLLFDSINMHHIAGTYCIALQSMSRTLDTVEHKRRSPIIVWMHTQVQTSFKAFMHQCVNFSGFVHLSIRPYIHLHLHASTNVYTVLQYMYMHHQCMDAHMHLCMLKIHDGSWWYLVPLLPVAVSSDKAPSVKVDASCSSVWP